MYAAVHVQVCVHVCLGVYSGPKETFSLFAFGQTLRQMLEMIKVESMFNHAFSKLEKAGAACPGRAAN